MSDAIRNFLNEPSKYGNKWLHDELPKHGFAVMDIDAITRRGYDSDKNVLGYYRLVEFKTGTSRLNLNQEIMLGKLDHALRLADSREYPDNRRYEGYFTVWTAYPHISMYDRGNLYEINDRPVEYKQLHDFFLSAPDIPAKPLCHDENIIFRKHSERKAGL
jgi:hypothetical protein